MSHHEGGNEFTVAITCSRRRHCVRWCCPEYTTLTVAITCREDVIVYGGASQNTLPLGPLPYCSISCRRRRLCLLCLCVAHKMHPLGPLVYCGNYVQQKTSLCTTVQPRKYYPLGPYNLLQQLLAAENIFLCGGTAQKMLPQGPYNLLSQILAVEEPAVVYVGTSKKNTTPRRI